MWGNRHLVSVGNWYYVSKCVRVGRNIIYRVLQQSGGIRDNGGVYIVYTEDELL